jgi:hypothetical protein
MRRFRYPVWVLLGLVADPPDVDDGTPDGVVDGAGVVAGCEGLSVTRAAQNAGTLSAPRRPRSAPAVPAGSAGPGSPVGGPASGDDDGGRPGWWSPLQSLLPSLFASVW